MKKPGSSGPENTYARNEESFRIFRNQSCTTGTESGNVPCAIEKNGDEENGGTGKENVGNEKRKEHSGLKRQGGREKSRIPYKEGTDLQAEAVPLPPLRLCLEE